MKNDLFREEKPVILIVDDVTRNVRELAGILKNEGLEIISAMEGNQALEMARQHIPDLVLLDIMIPGIDGIEVCRLLKQDGQTSAIPIILLTIQSETDDIIRGLNAGAIDYIAKPFIRVELLARVRAHIESIRAQKLLKLYRTQYEVEKSENQALSAELLRLKEVMEKMTTEDDLTELFNYKYTMRRLSQIINEARRYGYNLSVIMFDIDQFRRVKGRFGHQVGNDVLASVGAEIKRNIRESDIAGRYSGEEFLVILPHTDNEGGKKTAERIRANVEKLEWETRGLRVTVSGGVSTLESDQAAKTENILYNLIMKADNLLFKAKEKGRNRIETE